MANRAFRSLLALVLLFSSAALYAQSVNVTAANSSNDAIYTVTFSNGGGSIDILNTDAGSLHHLTSLVFLTNPSSFQLDLLAADNQGSIIVRYPGDFHTGSPTTGTVVFNGDSGTGPAYPDGLSVDGQGDLFVVNAKPGNASNPQLWVLPSNGAGGFVKPVEIDSNYGSSEVLDDTLVVGTTITPPGGGQPVLNPGDLLVLSTNPSQVLLYHGSGGNGPLVAGMPTVLITLPTGALPGGLAFWPTDNSLLVTTSRGTIYQYQPPYTGTPTTFASGLGNGQFKIKTGIQSGLPYAFIANNNGGDILEFNGPNSEIAVVTSGVQHPQGLAVTNVNYAPITACQDQQTNGCDLLGQEVITHNVPTNLSLVGNVVENVCLVPVDPRLANGGSCTTSLPVSQVCAGFSDTIVIPPSLCGSSGPTGQGFALVKTLTQAYQSPFAFNGSLVFSDSNLQNILPPSPTDPVCNPPGTPLGTLAWAPLPGEGIVAEGNNLVEVTSGCDGGGSRESGLSMFGVGLSINTVATGGLASFAAGKYTTLTTTLQGEVQEGALPAAINPGTQPPDGNLTYQVQQCINTSQMAFGKGASYYVGAAKEALAADQTIAAVASQSPPFTPKADYPNPSGSLRMRLQNIYYTINTRLDGATASATTPFPPPPPPAPVISGTPATSAKQGTLYSFTPAGADFTGNTTTVTYSIVNKPSWASFNYANGQLSGIAVKGTYPNIVITVTDGCASASLPAFQIRVN